MVSKVVEVNSTSYTKLDTTLESALDCVAADDSEITVVFATAQPAIATKGYPVTTSRGVVRNGHTGDMWAKTGGGVFTADVVVGE
jgi:hypothetical protein